MIIVKFYRVEPEVAPIYREYDKDMVKKLKEYGYRYILIGRDLRSLNKMYLYINTDKLQDCREVCWNEIIMARELKNAE